MLLFYTFRASADRAIVNYHSHAWGKELAMPHKPRSVRFDIPATYRIRAEGRPNASWSEYLQGVTIDGASEPSEKPVVTLNGRLADQSALAGLLNHIYDLGLTLLYVERLDADEGTTPVQNPDPLVEE
jgi:hypothetical protein